MNAPTLDKVLTCPSLPTLPAVAIRLLELTRDPEVELGSIAKLVQHDQALTSRILRTVNSSYYHLAQPCPTIKRALTYLGLNTVKSLVLGFSLVELSKNCDASFDLLDYWRRCLYSAAAARRIALSTGACDPDEVFIAALMQDIGMLAMHAALGSDYGDLITETKGNHFMLPRCESTALGFTHADAGAQLGVQWHLPDQLVKPIRYHHQGGIGGYGNDAMVNAVILASRIANLLSADDPKPVLSVVDAMSQALFHLSMEDERELLAMISADTEELSSLLDVEIAALPDIGVILADADDALMKHRLDKRKKNERLNPSPIHKEREVITGSLTGVGNRRLFDLELAAGFKKARQEQGTLGLILADADDFASINEALGRAAGDEVLRQLARRLQAGVGTAGRLCRFKGEQFGILVPGLSRFDAARLAERLRRAVEKHQIELQGVYAQITLSFGVAALEPDVAAQLNRPELLVQLADKALKAAKQAGRNRVRVFNPGPSKASAA